MVNYKDLGLVNTREMFKRAVADGYVKVPKSVELLDEGEEVEVYLFNIN